MGGRARGSFIAPQYRQTAEPYMSRYEQIGNQSVNQGRSVRAPQTYGSRVEPANRDYLLSREKAIASAREVDRNLRGPTSMRANEIGRTSYGQTVQSAGRAPDLSISGGYPTSRSDNQYKYANEGWFKTTQPPNTIPAAYGDNTRSRDYSASRDGYGFQPSSKPAPEHYHYNRSAETPRGSAVTKEPRTYANPEVVLETRQLEERVAAIQRELEMLEKDNSGSRSSDYRSSRNAYPASNATRNLPPSRNYAPRINPMERARIEREEVNLRMREEQLRRREQELHMEHERVRERMFHEEQMRRARHQEMMMMMMEPPRARSHFPAPNSFGRRAAPPSRLRAGTFPKNRGFRASTHQAISTKPKYPRKPTVRAKATEKQKKPAKPRKDLDTNVPEKEKSLPKQEMKKKPAFVKSKKVKKTPKAEDPTEKSDGERSTDALIEQILGKDKEVNDFPRARSLAKLFKCCEKGLLAEEIRGQIGVFFNEERLEENNDNDSRANLRTYNPTTLGSLDQYVPLYSFEEEVVMDVCDEVESKTYLENLKSQLAVFPMSPAA